MNKISTIINLNDFTLMKKKSDLTVRLNKKLGQIKLSSGLAKELHIEVGEKSNLYINSTRKQVLLKLESTGAMTASKLGSGVCFISKSLVYEVLDIVGEFPFVEVQEQRMILLSREELI